MDITTAKLNLIEWLIKVKDETILSKIELLRNTNAERWDELTPGQQAEIEEAFTELDSGHGIAHHEVMTKLRKR
ncbi:MAG TPA: hypothetical protein VI757_16305 [Bacteroidia bacterium]|nr:hypothetical protein [Bacteroidia bacterium]